MVMSSSEMSSLKDTLATEFPSCFTKQFMDLNNPEYQHKLMILKYTELGIQESKR